MESYFGAAASLVRSQNRALRSLETIKPQSGGVPYALLGTAIDYRIRFYFQDAINQRLVAQQGAALLVSEGGTLDLGNVSFVDFEPGPRPYPTLAAPSVSDFFDALNEFVLALPAAELLEQYDEETLCRFCVVLAYFEQAYRAGPERLADSPLPSNRSPTVDDLLSIVRDDWVKDLAAQSQLFHARAGDRVTQPHRLNPTFGGSNDVGGADADLIIGSTLIDIKATVHPKISRLWLWQLLGYALLDYSDQYSIGRVGVYLSRQGHFVEWPVEELAQAISSRGAISWDVTRHAFQQEASVRAA